MIQKGIPLAGICSLSIFLPPFPLLFLPLLPPSSPPLSHHHSKMLPGPVLVVMVTETRGIFTWPELPGLWLDGRAEVRREGWGWGGGCRVVMSRTHRFPSGRDPQSGRLQTHTDTMGGFFFFFFFKVGLNGVLLSDSQGWCAWIDLVTCWLT